MIWQKIKKHWDDSRRTYGRRRITKKLKNDGEIINRKRVARLMKENNIQGIGKKKFKPQTTYIVILTRQILAKSAKSLGV